MLKYTQKMRVFIHDILGTKKPQLRGLVVYLLHPQIPQVSASSGIGYLGHTFC